jgi:hypothetical protein
MTPAATTGGPAASLLLSGDATVYDRHGGALAALGSGTYLGADPGRAAAHDVALLPGIIDAVAAQIAAGRYPGDAATIASAAAGMAHIVETAHGHGMEARALESVHTLARAAVNKGHGTDGFARLAEVLRGE